MTIHSKFAPSSMDKIVACYGFIQMVQGEDPPETEEQREGTAAHWVGQSMLTSRKNATGTEHDPYRITIDYYIGETAPNGVIITEDMFDAALCYYNEVMKIAGSGLIQMMQIEERVIMPLIHPDCFGTPDCFIFDAGSNILYVFDFKYGHKKVVAGNNWQLFAYDLGALLTVDEIRLTGQYTIANHIIQPRCYSAGGPVSVTTFVDSELRGLMNIMSHACAKSEQDDVQVSTGSHCVGCAARYKCPAILNAVAGIIDYSTSALPVELSPEGLAYELQLLEKAKELLKYREDAMVNEGLKRLHDGVSVPGYGLKQGYSTSKWKYPVKDVITMGTLMGVNLEKEPDVITPFQAGQMLKRNNIDPDTIESYSEKVPTSMRLTVDDGSKAKQIFSQEKI